MKRTELSNLKADILRAKNSAFVNWTRFEGGQNISTFRTSCFMFVHTFTLLCHLSSNSPHPKRNAPQKRCDGDSYFRF